MMGPVGGDPGSPYRLDRMTPADLPEVLEIERASFEDPWSRAAFLHEIGRNPFAVNLVLREQGGEGEIVAYACLHCIEDEAEINNVAVDPGLRGLGLGRLLMSGVISEAAERGCRVASLQVRRGNAAARELYRRLGFIECGVRKRYYSGGEDAILMMKPLI